MFPLRFLSSCKALRLFVKGVRLTKLTSRSCSLPCSCVSNQFWLVAGCACLLVRPASTPHLRRLRRAAQFSWVNIRSEAHLRSLPCTFCWFDCLASFWQLYLFTVNVTPCLHAGSTSKPHLPRQPQLGFMVMDYWVNLPIVWALSCPLAPFCWLSSSFSTDLFYGWRHALFAYRIDLESASPAAAATLFYLYRLLGILLQGRGFIHPILLSALRVFGRFVL